jgi:hypothetical protein
VALCHPNLAMASYLALVREQIDQLLRENAL